MFVLYARYRGRERRRAELVRTSAARLSTLPGAGEFEVVSVEDIVTCITSAEVCCDLALALLSHGDWAIAIAIAPQAEQARRLARTTLGSHARAGVVKVGIRRQKEKAEDIAGAFILLAYLLHKRTPEGREATSLMRRGYTQNEAAMELGISKQAMSQRLQAAGWQAELAGWRLAVRFLQAADEKKI
ncbi:MarR family transcriptional regulator [Corynebacterium sp. ES2794-CONJ1]|uniref:MarR family transcriptional regulator n=1 Tax=unclassified Corynebacterium TaxID=2624378 RepID=UPI00216729C0|nr:MULTISPECIES: MarR family transcriptional regulator [unclassified Corynebacterium]MCS4489319.1 MarR family transcriptional regulator [Corynebacterium sp. ES2775-CONJ]MCS4491132.1 MarR family transcriptional regulator [Corynebacterium sp. ES2715-CONJ3]MCS4530987.1 MarR family transcriptional regulator [Corynebacterium sp. ES2730-CONJ]MCU9518354.1 MarR family transcriptional regulator [Corynebacterium sp. ES2794-CONJ1]